MVVVVVVVLFLAWVLLHIPLSQMPLSPQIFHQDYYCLFIKSQFKGHSFLQAGVRCTPSSTANSHSIFINHSAFYVFLIHLKWKRAERKSDCKLLKDWLWFSCLLVSSFVQCIIYCIVNKCFLFVSSVISFFSVVYFSEYRSFTSLVRFIPRHFIFMVATSNGIFFLISASDISLLVYKNTFDFWR